jgi:hypothetical protein
VHCFAGCSIEAITSAIGLAIADLFDDAPPHSRQRTLADIHGGDRPAMTASRGGRSRLPTTTEQPSNALAPPSPARRRQPRSTRTARPEEEHVPWFIVAVTLPCNATRLQARSHTGSAVSSD